MNPEKSLRFWKIRKEKYFDRTVMTTWIKRKDFKKLTADKNCFGKITPGIKPELMNEDEYRVFIKGKPEAKMVL